jgi:hypothetical protein
MIYVVCLETWSVPRGTREAELKHRLGPIAGARDQVTAAMRARELAVKFDHHGLQDDARHPYWWGRNDNESVVHRLVIRPAA